ncbi:hypothetical protein GE118_03070 [Mycoplasma sp. NEAQ87857]|uniref:BC85_0335 family putative methyltransferase n=1 Tax=Mycoplasma sp. NEAQ87857 TaxID=2683967 RepID=UPI0013163A9C|nr:hypothetical protein [Mycoplasma sp. NEAQ87857]QGZ97771.1 hypothetical protein GE118_03070 [Mycoplasma sp. NEAQ87857]
MEQFIINIYAEAQKASALSSTTRTWLIVSAIVVFVIAISFYIGVVIWSKKLRKKMNLQAQKEAMIQIENIRNDVGVLPLEIQDYLKAKDNLYDIEGAINTVYRNNYQNVLVLAKDHLFSFASISSKTKNPIFYDINDLDYQTFSKIQLEFASEFSNVVKAYQDQELDLVIAYSCNMLPSEIYDKYFPKLINNGMMIIKYDKKHKKDFNALAMNLQAANLDYEFNYFGTKFLFIAKRTKTEVANNQNNK